MLVLVSFGLVLLATILLVVGLLNDDGLTLIYLSIGSSITAAVVLYLAFRRARPQAESAAAPPVPLDEVMASAPAAAAAAIHEPTATAPVVSEPAPAPAPEPEPEPPVAAATAPTDEWSADDDNWADEELEFPIADYDDLKVGEIMPLLPQLYSDELGVVAAREKAGKNRTTILNRLAELAETGTEADRLEAEAADEVDVPAAAVVDDTSAEPEEAFVEEEAADEVEDEDLADLDDDGYFFPIADYDELTVGQILPLLPQLELDELEDVKAREAAGAARTSLLAEIDRYLSGELEIVGYVEDEEPAPPAPPARKAPAKKAAKKATKKAPAKKAAKKAAATKATKKAPAKKAAKKRASAGRFPIANYDGLTVAEIRPRLTKLSDSQLAQVRDRELAGAGRKTILNDIDSRLG